MRVCVKKEKRRGIDLQICLIKLQTNQFGRNKLSQTKQTSLSKFNRVKTGMAVVGKEGAIELYRKDGCWKGSSVRPLRR